MADRCALRLIAPSSPTLAWLAAGTASFGGGAAAQVIEFDEPAFYPLSEIQHVVVSADLNGDSGIDVVVATLEELQVYINDGGGTLTLAISIPAVPTAVQLLAVDMDGDHDVDLVWRDESFSEMVVWYNDGSGQSGETIAVPTQAQGAVDMAAADVSDDGLVDLVLAVDPPVVAALVNQGDRTFVRHDLYWHIPSHEEPMRLVCGDMDEDGDADIVAVFQYLYRNYYNYYDVKDAHAVLLINDGGLAFRQQSNTYLPMEERDNLVQDIALGDLDGDGDLDVAIGADQAEWFSSGETEVLLVSNEDGALLTFVDAHVIARADECAVTIADLNTDGRLEILLARYPGWEAGIIPLLNEGAWAFTELDAIRTDEFGPAFSSSDLNGDGQIDLIHAGERALATAMNITSLPGPFFDHTPLRRGEPAEFVVIGGVPGETAHFLYSLGAPEPSRGVRTLGGITLDLADPITRFGAATVQPDGRAALRRTIPANAPLRTVTTQAVIRRGPGGADSVKTPFRTARIGP